MLSTKVGRVLRPGAPGSAQMTWAFDFSAAGARASFESSLERLGLERVDILFVHDPDDHYQPGRSPEAFPVLMELRAQGLVKAIGAGMNQWQMELDFARAGHCDCFLLAGRYTLLDQSALPEFLPYCVEHGIGVVAGGPYNSGILAVGPREGATFNYRAGGAGDDGQGRAHRRGLRAPWRALAAAALQFILAHPAIVSVIPGARSLAEVEENVRMVEHPIPAALWAELKDAGLLAAAAPDARLLALAPLAPRVTPDVGILSACGVECGPAARTEEASDEDATAGFRPDRDDGGRVRSHAAAQPLAASDFRSLAGTYTGTMNEASELDRAVRLVLEPNGSFELVVGDPKGFRTIGQMALVSDGSLN